MHLLMVHGNGGAESRFELFRRLVEEQGSTDLQLVFPELPGFSGRSFPKGSASWEPLLRALSDTIRKFPDASWIFYGHGIGGSLLLEWAARDWRLSDGGKATPIEVILHGCIGASLENRFFPKIMQLPGVRFVGQWLIWQPWLRKIWEKKLFLYPERIPGAVRRQFFQDYKVCEAFPLIFDLITPAWYHCVQKAVGDEAFLFLWGERERVVASRHLEHWQEDFPQSTFRVIPEWDHFPMLDQPDLFFDVIMDVVQLNARSK